MEARLAKIISVLFHPVLMPTYIIAILLNFNAYFILILPMKARTILLGMVFVSTCILPLSIILLIMHSGKVLSLQMEKQQERIFSLLVTTIFYGLTWWMLRQMPVSKIFQLVAIGIFYTSVAALTINFIMKISLHMIAVGGAAGVFIGLSLLLIQPVQMLIIVTIFLGGIIGFARLKLNAHNPAQVYIGWIVGLLIMLSVMNQI
jgi:hypothetical protein